MESSVEYLERKNIELKELLDKSLSAEQDLRDEVLALRSDSATNVLNVFRLIGVACVSIDKDYDQIRYEFKSRAERNKLQVPSDSIYRDLRFLEQESLPNQVKTILRDYLSNELGYDASNGKIHEDIDNC